MKTKGFLASLVALSMSVSAVAAPGGRAAAEIAKMPGFSTIETYAAKSGIKSDLPVASLFASAINGNRLDLAKVERVFQSISDTRLAAEKGKIPAGLGKQELETQLTNRVFALLLSAGCTSQCNVNLVGNVTTTQVIDVLASGEKLANLNGWSAENLKGLNRLISLLSSRLLALGAQAKLDKDGTINGSVLSQALLGAVEQYLKDTRSKLSPQQFVEALITNCA